MDQDSFFKVLNRMSELYISYRGRYVMATKEGYFVPKGKTLTDSALIAHLNGKFAVGVYAGPYASKFVCFDVDLSAPSIVKQVVDALVEFGFPRDLIYVSSSGGKGFHVEMFFDGTMYTNYLRDMYETVCFVHHFDKRKIEFRPTSGMSIKLPLGVHPKTNNVCWYLDPDTLEPIRDMSYILQIKTMSRDWATELIKKNRETVQLPPLPPIVARRFPKDEYPQITAPGMRHSLMLGIAVRERERGTSQEEIERRLLDWVAKQPEDFIKTTPQEVKKDAREISSYVWNTKFRLASKEIFITETDLETLLSLRGMAKKKLLFLLILFYRKFGVVKMSYDRMAEYTGISRGGIVKALSTLKEEEGRITVKPGKKYHAKGVMCSLPNEYSYKPDISKPMGEKIQVGWDFRPESFQKLYAGFMAEHVAESRMTACFTPKEREELLNILHVKEKKENE